MENLKMNRIMAYIIDIFIISILTTLLSYVNFINPNSDKYKEVYTEYSEYYESITNNTTTMDDMNALTEDMTSLMYKLSYYGMSYSITEIVVIILYFTLFPFFFDGQTIGKKLLKVKLVNEDKKKPSFITLLLRSLFIPTSASMLMYTTLSNTVAVLSLFIFKNTAYVYASSIISIIATVYCYIDIIFMLKDKENGLSLHDKLFKTKVIKC